MTLTTLVITLLRLSAIKRFSAANAEINQKFDLLANHEMGGGGGFQQFSTPLGKIFQTSATWLYFKRYDILVCERFENE